MHPLAQLGVVWCGVAKGTSVKTYLWARTKGALSLMIFRVWSDRLYIEQHPSMVAGIDALERRGTRTISPRFGESDAANTCCAAVPGAQYCMHTSSSDWQAYVGQVQMT